VWQLNSMDGCGPEVVSFGGKSNGVNKEAGIR